MKRIILILFFMLSSSSALATNQTRPVVYIVPAGLGTYTEYCQGNIIGYCADAGSGILACQ